MALIKKTLRFLIIGGLLAYFVAATMMLGVRYLVLPHINEWRPDFERRLSLALDARVTMGEIAANWSGLNPTLSLGNLRLHDHKTGTQLLYVPDAFAVVSWRSLFTLDPRFRQLEINGIELSGSRRPDGRLTFAGTLLDEQSGEKLSLSTDAPAIRWLLQQGRIAVRGATFRWDDQLRDAPELVVEDIDFTIVNGIFRHQLRLSGTLPKELGGAVELIAQTDNIFNPLASHEQADAEIFIEIDDAQPSAWQPWVDMPAKVEGRLAARMWVEVSGKRFGRATVDLAGAHVAFSAGAVDPIAARADRLQIRANGWLGDLFAKDKWLVFDRSPNRVGLALDVSGQALQVETSLFEPSQLPLGEMAIKTQWNRGSDEKLRLNVTQFNVQSDALTAKLQGTWTQDEAALGVVDFTGSVNNLAATKLHHYASTAFSAESREWMRRAFVHGTFDLIDLKLKGDLSNFPFNKADQSGVFSLSAQYSDMLIDYDYVEPNKPQWPAVQIDKGTLLLDKLALSVKSDQATVSGVKGQQVRISELELIAPDLWLNPNLLIRANSRGFAPDYLAVLSHTPIAHEMSATLESLHLKGEATMLLSVDFDMDKHLATSVKGEINVSDMSIALSKEGLPVEKLNGVIQFTEDQVMVKQMQGEMLGGPLLLKGEWGPHVRNLTLEGALTSAASEKYQSFSKLLAVTGRTTYQAEMKGREDGGFDAQLNSTLEGLTLKLPAPLGKTAGQRRPLSVRFLKTNGAKDQRQSLTFSYGNLLNGQFEHVPGARSQTHFSRGSVVMGGPAVLPAAGLSVNLGFGAINWSDWKTLTDQWTAAPNNQTKDSTPGIFPPLQQLRVRSPEFIFAELALHELELMVSRTSPQRWAARLESRETQGVANWSTGPRGLSGPVVAKFSKLKVGTEGTANDEPPKTEVIDDQQWSSMPAIDLTVDDFTLFGSRLGSLHLVGENIQNGAQWSIKELELSNPHAKMSAKGTWQLKGPQRGVSLDAEIAITDLGKLSDQMGHVNRVYQGSGTVSGKINWLNFPWVYTYVGLQGQVNVDLKNGVFQHVDSRSARLLEVLSLQSLQRILSFNFRTGDEFKDGFPWNTIKGDFVINNGLVTTKDLVVRSPIARIALVGGSDLNKKTWDMDADVRPILDMSGAAVATAFVVNPIAGLSALVSQFLLRNPIERAMSAKYRVKGPWDEPVLEPIGEPTPVPMPNDIGN
ncbi:AsmA-like C-terminal region-containing protein [Zwartia sp.]|uniref:YhdP family phospholipid transporter n=1 Tax=Zwartia sp. TaxID=2978004 RepID=UPI0027252856|nr:AsmA-like C-terminal region-containing protein [Zwartia sp.]MDO9025336.1 AsmA-like C-terminal region-containing protein [Zwartia sp.]